MINFIISFLCCAIPDSLYFTLLITNIKQIKDKKIILFILILIGYTIFVMLLQYNFLLYVLFIVHIYLCLKLLYNIKIYDIFLIIFAYLYLIVSNIFGSMFNGINYYLGYVINKIVMFSILMFTKKITNVYKFYLNNWNRSNNNKVKSITIRNIGLLTTNIMLIILDICLILTTIYCFGS